MTASLLDVAAHIGIDPGLSGALVALSPSGAVLLAERCPLFKGEPDIRAATELVASLPRPWLAVTEKPAYIGRNSGYLALKSSNKFWRKALGVDVLDEVAIGTWQRAILKNQPGEGTKAQSIGWCRANLPDLDLLPGRCTVPHDGLADAACIAEWGRRRIVRVERAPAGAGRER